MAKNKTRWKKIKSTNERTAKRGEKRFYVIMNFYFYLLHCNSLCFYFIELNQNRPSTSLFCEQDECRQGSSKQKKVCTLCKCNWINRNNEKTTTKTTENWQITIEKFIVCCKFGREKNSAFLLHFLLFRFSNFFYDWNRCLVFVSVFALSILVLLLFFLNAYFFWRFVSWRSVDVQIFQLYTLGSKCMVSLFSNSFCLT